MADQVSFTGSLAAGVSQASTVVSRPQPVPERAPATRSADAQAANPAPEDKGAPAGTVNSAAEAFGAYLQQHQQELVFQVDQVTGETVFRIVNAKTKEVIRQVPSEDILVMARKLRELDHSKGASGVLVDKVG